jgi:cytochrome c oxidase assembly protein subunit 15
MHQNIWLHRFSVFLAGATLLLIAAGASVTSTGSGLAVPDWPLSFGQFFPPMVGGVLYEHGHRMIAGVIVALTVILTVWIHRKEDRRWVKRLSIVALLSLFLQAALGGITVLFKLPTAVSVSHAGLAQLFFCMTVTLALVTSPAWAASQNRLPRTHGPSIRGFALAASIAIYVQIILGAVMRHTGAGLAIGDFPLTHGGIFPAYYSQPIVIHYLHRVGAFAVTLIVIALLIQVLRGYRGQDRFVRPALWLGGLLVFQIFLGGLTIWTKRAVIPTTAHVAVGAAVLAASLVLTLRAYRFAPARAALKSHPADAREIREGVFDG